MSTSTPPIRLIVNRTIRAEMARRRLTQTSLAEALGSTQSVISRRLNGTAPWDIDELAAVAEVFNMDPADLLDTSWAEAAL